MRVFKEMTEAIPQDAQGSVVVLAGTVVQKIVRVYKNAPDQEWRADVKALGYHVRVGAPQDQLEEVERMDVPLASIVFVQDAPAA